jgi:hypothetical protein
MLTIILALLAGTFGGTLAGGLISWQFLRPPPSHKPLDLNAIDPDEDEQINRAASRWAKAHHRPGAAPLVADKLRLVYTLNRRRSGRGR